MADNDAGDWQATVEQNPAPAMLKNKVTKLRHGGCATRSLGRREPLKRRG